LASVLCQPQCTARTNKTFNVNIRSNSEIAKSETVKNSVAVMSNGITIN
jgi:methylphosphotriester-DNA--protein-cysteine methyltransferase